MLNANTISGVRYKLRLIAIGFISPSHRDEYMNLAQQYQPVDLGKGYSDYAAPKYITDALAATANSENPLLNQYARGFVSGTLKKSKHSKHLHFSTTGSCTTRERVIYAVLKVD